MAGFVALTARDPSTGSQQELKTDGNGALLTNSGSGVTVDTNIAEVGGVAVTSAVGVPTSTPSAVSATNSSTTPLGSSAAFTGAWVSTLGYGSIVVNVTANTNSATDGLSIQQSSDGVNADIPDVYTLTAPAGANFCIPVKATFARVVYTNTNSAQATFRLQTILKPQMPVSSAFRPADAVSIQNDFPGGLSIQQVYNGTTVDLSRSIVGALAAGTGTQAIAEAPTSVAGAAIVPAVTAVAAGSLVIKGTPGNLYGVAVNLPTGAVAQKLMLFNATSAPADGVVTPIKVFDVPAAGTFATTFSPPIRFSVGCTAVLSTTGPFTKTIALTTNLGFLSGDVV